jgi:hypothetical protein
LSTTADNFNTLVKPQPTSEYQIRPLAILEPAQQREVWEEAVKTAPAGKVTSKHVANTVKELTAPAPELNPPSVSHSGFASSGPPRRTPFAHLYPSSLGAPFAGHGGAVVALRAVDLSFQGGSGGAFQGAGAPGGRGWPEKGHGTLCRFLPACCFRCQHLPVPHP